MRIHLLFSGAHKATLYICAFLLLWRPQTIWSLGHSVHAHKAFGVDLAHLGFSDHLTLRVSIFLLVYIPKFEVKVLRYSLSTRHEELAARI